MSWFLPQFEWMVELQLTGAAALLLLAVWRLRPTFRRQEDTPARRTWFAANAGLRRRWRWLAPPACGDDAIGWKERHFAQTDIFTRMILLPAIVAVTLPLAIYTMIEGGIGDALLNFWRYGLDARRMIRDEFLLALRVDLGWYTAFWLLAVAGAAASSVTIERERDTWVTLTSTPLSGWEILRAKVLGAIWNQRGFAAVMAFLWLLVLATGAAHPLGVLASVALVGVLTWFVAVLGIDASLRAMSTSRSLASTIVALCVYNGYPIILLVSFLGGVWFWWHSWTIGWESSFSLLGAMPRLAVAPLVSPEFAGRVLSSLQTGGLRSLTSASYVVIVLFPLAIYLAVGAYLSWRVVGRFDHQIDRPRPTGPLVATRNLMRSF
jgi:hypothetical protein